MKILHCCFANFYIDNYGYQENILTKHHMLLGHDVKIVASTENYSKSHRIVYETPGTYFNEYGIEVTRLPYIRWIPHYIARKLRIYIGIYQILIDFKPEVIFIHGPQFMGISSIVKYARKNTDVKIIVDCHTDFINSAKGIISKYILHGIIYRWCTKKIEPFVDKFYGVTPVRSDFLNKVYGIDKSKIDLLVMGCDDSYFSFSERESIRENKRVQLELSSDDFVIITGGRIDLRKKIHVLMKSISNLPIPNVKLIVIGEPVQEMIELFDTYRNDPKIICIGWVPQDKIHEIIFASDLGFFPGTHSVLWEQSVGLGLPCVFKRWPGFEHIDIGGNCIFIESSEENEITNIINNIYHDKKLFSRIQSVAMSKGPQCFSYSKISIKSLDF